MMINRTVVWLSGGVSSFIAAYLVKDDIDDLIYVDIDDQHADTLRFVRECADVLGKPLTILKSIYGSVGNVCKTFRYVNGVGGARCTQVLKMRVRKEWEYEHEDEHITYVWGFDKKELSRAERLNESMPEFNHRFPLIDYGISKENAHAMCEQLGIKRPFMYELGYRNNNCIGCVKGGMGYWNRIRKDFPEVFKMRAEMEREIGHSCIKGVFLDELDPKRGRLEEEILPDCGIFCELALEQPPKEAESYENFYSRH